MKPKSRKVGRTTAKQRPPSAGGHRVSSPAKAAAAPPPGHKMSQVSADCSDLQFVPKPVHLRLAEAYEDALQTNQNPTDSVIAKKLDVRRETIVRWRRQRPELWRWLYHLIGEQAARLRPLVDRRVTQLAIQGSPEHTKLFYQFVAKVGTPFDERPAVQAPAIVNILVPHRGMPNGGQVPPFGQVVGTPRVALQGQKPVTAARDIPTVLVR